MTDGFATGLILGLLVWVAIIWWHRRQAAKSEARWMDAIKATQAKPEAITVYADPFVHASPRERALQAERAVDAALSKQTKKRTKKRK